MNLLLAPRFWPGCLPFTPPLTILGTPFSEPPKIMLRLALITVPLLCLSAFVPASAPALDGPYLKDSDLKKLAQSFNDYIEASVAREGVLKAENEVGETLEKLGRKLRKAPIDDILASPLDLGRALWMSKEYTRKRVKFGSIQDGVYDQTVPGGDGPLKYAILAPADYDKGKKKSWPLVLCVPGVDETPQETLLENWSDGELHNQVILVCPEMPKDADTWTGMPGVGTMLILFRAIYEDWAIDYNKVFISGRGAGVNAALSIAGKFPELFAGVIGRSGDAGDAPSENFSNLPTWFSGGGSGVTAWEAKIKEAGWENCTVDPEGREKEILGWLNDTERNGVPTNISLVPGSPFPTRAYWLEVPAGDEDGALVEARVDRDTNTIHVDATLVPTVTLLFNDLLVDLSKPVKVVINGVEHTDLLPRSYRTCLKLIFQGTNDPGRVFVAKKAYSVPPKAKK